MKIIDAINDRSGDGVIRLAAQLVNDTSHKSHNDGYSTSFQSPRPENPNEKLGL